MRWRRLSIVLAVGALVGSVSCGDGGGGGGGTATPSTTTTEAGQNGGGAAPNGAASSGTNAAADDASDGGAAGSTEGGSSSNQGGTAARVGAPPGLYTFTVKGTTRTEVPPTTRPYETTQRMKVDPPNGDRQHRAEWLENAYDATEATFEYRTNEVRLVEFKLTSPEPKDFVPPEPVLWLPRPALSRKSWTWDMRSTDRTTTMHAELASAPDETVTVGGEPVRCWVLKVKRTFVSEQEGGKQTVTEDRTEWISMAHLLPVKVQFARTSETKGLQGGFHGEATYELQSLKPAAA